MGPAPAQQAAAEPALGAGPAPAVAPSSAAAAPAPQPAPGNVVPASAGSAPEPHAGRWMLTSDGQATWVPAGYELPPVLPYREGQPIPVGYHLEERPSRGALTTGYLLTGIPYGIGLIAAFSSEFTNQSAYLFVPWAGPWLTLGLRDSACQSNDEVSEATTSDSLSCVTDAMVVSVLIIDGIIQAAGGTVLLVSYLAPRQKLVRDELGLGVMPLRMGTGYGLGAFGRF